MRSDSTTKSVFTIITTSANADNGFFQDPTPCGCFLSAELAQIRFMELIAKEKENLNIRYDTENREETLWEMCENGYAAACFVRIEIIETEIEDWSMNNE